MFFTFDVVFRYPSPLLPSDFIPGGLDTFYEFASDFIPGGLGALHGFASLSVSDKFYFFRFHPRWAWHITRVRFSFVFSDFFAFIPGGFALFGSLLFCCGHFLFPTHRLISLHICFSHFEFLFIGSFLWFDLLWVSIHQVLPLVWFGVRTCINPAFIWFRFRLHT